MPDTNSNRFDEQLRGKANRYRKEPTDRVWEKLQTGLQTPAPRKNYRAAGLLLLGLLLVLLGNMLPPISNLFSSAQTSQVAQNHAPAAVSGRFARESQTSETKAEAHSGSQLSAKQAGAIATEIRPRRKANQQLILAQAPAGKKQTKSTKQKEISASEEEKNQHAATLAQEKKAAPLAVLSEAKTEEVLTKENGFPEVFQTLVGTEQEMQQQVVAESPEAAESQAMIKAIEAQKQELAKLQLRADSLLAVYLRKPAGNGLWLTAADTAAKAEPKPRWFAALAVAPELNFMHLSAPAADTLLEMRRNHESGRAGASAALSLEYQLSNKLRLGAGIGYSTYGAELRLTNTQTQLHVRYDTATQVTTQHFTQSHTNYIVQQDSTAILDPVFNQSGQVIGYNTVYVTHPDTTWHTVIIEGTDTIRTQTITPLIHQTQKTTYRKLKPQYHFVTLPVMLYYKLTPGKRWYAEAGAGGQLQLFRGGTQLVTEDGRTYHTEKVGPNEGPFRPVNLALMGNVSVNYGLTERLSVSVAPAVRWQVQSVYKKETGLKQKPLATGVQFGLRFRL